MFSFLIKILLATTFTLHLHSEINLETNPQDFVLKTKQIKIPDYPYAFNPSIIQWEGKILMSFRVIAEGAKMNAFCSSADSSIGLVFLDNDFNPITDPQILSFNCKNERPEDTRLITVKNKLFLIYSDNRNDIVTEGGFRMYVTELLVDQEKISIGHTDSILQFEGEHQYKREKNWVPFDYDGHLLMAYSLSPHKILYPLPYSETALTISITNPGIQWDFGELRGGTSALVDEGEYLAFFHSSKMMSTVHSKGEQIPHYFMGAYTFSKEPPFEINKISTEPIIAKGFYEGAEYSPYWHPVSVIFPCGFIADEHSVYISYGRQDHEIWIVKLDKKGLKKSLREVY